MQWKSSADDQASLRGNILDVLYDTVVPIGEGKYESIQPVNNNNNNDNNNNNNNNNDNNNDFIRLLTQITGKLLSVSS